MINPVIFSFSGKSEIVCPSLLSMWVALFSGASVINQVKENLNMVMKTLPDRKNLAGELIPVILQVAGPENCFQNLLGNNLRSDGIAQGSSRVSAITGAGLNCFKLESIDFKKEW